MEQLGEFGLFGGALVVAKLFRLLLIQANRLFECIVRRDGQQSYEKSSE